MSKFIVVSCVYPPEPVVSARTSASLVNGLLQAGHAVRVITAFPNRPGGKVYPGFRRRLFWRERAAQGLDLIRCFAFLSPTSSTLSRWLENISFGITSGLALLFSPRPEAVYSNSWPIFATGLVGLVCALRRLPLVIHVKDLYPESLSMQGRVGPGGLPYRLLMALDRWLARRASAMVVLSERHAQAYRGARGIAEAKIHVVPDWIDIRQAENWDKQAYREQAGISREAFVLVYGGNIGLAAGVEGVLEALQRVESQRKIVLVVAGSGSQLESCRRLAEKVSAARIIFHSPWREEETGPVLAAADACILPTQGKQSLASVPSKLLSYLLAARPVLAQVLPESDTANVIAQAGCGWVVSPDRPQELAVKIAELALLPEETLAAMGLAGRRYVQETLSVDVCLPQLIGILNDASARTN